MANQGYGFIIITFIFVGIIMLGMLMASGALDNRRPQIYPYQNIGGAATADPYVGDTIQEIVEQSDNPVLLVHVDAVSSLPPHYFTEFLVFVVDN